MAINVAKCVGMPFLCHAHSWWDSARLLELGEAGRDSRLDWLRDGRLTEVDANKRRAKALGADVRTCGLCG